MSTASKGQRAKIDVIAPGTNISVDGTNYGVVNRASDGVNVVAENGSWETLPYGTTVLVED